VIGGSLKAIAALTVAATLALAGCGGDDDGTTTSSSSVSTPQRATTTTQSQKKSGQRGDSKQRRSSSQSKETTDDSAPPPSGPPPTTSASLPNEGTKRPAPGVPTHKGGDNSIQTYGTEASSADRIEAAAALQGYLDARAAQDWEGACSYLSSSTQKLLEKFAERAPKLRGADCAEVMAALTEGVPRAALQAEAQIEVISLRVEGDSAFVIYESSGDRVSAIPMARENGAWKVSGMGATPLI
jgi:hypothetical protein